MASNIVVMTKKGKDLKVVQSAFDSVWKKKGWRLKDEKAPGLKPTPKAEEKSDPESATP